MDEETTLRVNLGGPDYRDTQGHIWEADREYHPGSWGCQDAAITDIFSTKDDISGTKDAPLYQSIRVGEEMRYRFDLPDGQYRVRILFAEIYWESTDAERQDVYIQGRKVLRNFSMFDKVGHDAALTKSFKVEVTQGHLDIRFVGLSLPMHSGARACAIEVERL